MKVKCLPCLIKGQYKDAEVIWNGHSLCRKCLLKAVSEYEKKKKEEKGEGKEGIMEIK